MRIKQEISYDGKFWLSGQTQEDANGGKLRIKEGGIIELEVVGDFNNSFINAFELNNERIATIFGILKNDKHVTFKNCTYKKKTTNLTSIIIAYISASIAYFNIIHEDEKPLTLDSLSFQLEGFSQCIGHQRLNTDLTKHERDKNIFSYKTDDMFQLDINYTHTSGFKTAEENEIYKKGNYICVLTANEPIEFNAFYKLVQSFARLISFLINDIATIYNVYGNSAEYEESFVLDSKTVRRTKKIDLYFQTWPYLKNSPQDILRNPFINQSQIYNNFNKIVKNWFSFYEVLAPAIKLYFALQTNKNNLAEIQFLTLAQALEYLARQKSKAKTLKQIMETLLKPLSTIIVKDKLNMLIADIVETRHYYTHYNAHKKDKAKHGIELAILAYKLKISFEFLLVLELGFDISELSKLSAKMNSNINYLNT